MGNLVPPKKSDPSSSPNNERAAKVEGGMSKGGLVSREKRKIPTTEPGAPSEEKSIPIKIESMSENSNMKRKGEKHEEDGKEAEATVTQTTSPEGEKSIPIKIENQEVKSGGGVKELRKLLTEEKSKTPTKKISKSESPQLGILFLKVKKAKNLESKDA